MYQLNYCSIASSGADLKDLNEILNTAIKRNAVKNITGCLIYHNNYFVQILEGDKQAVLDLYEKIKKDKKHHSVTLLWENSVDSRHFEEWNMAFYQPEENNMKQFVANFMYLATLADRSTGTLLSFWASVRKILDDGMATPLERV
ncbi:hypothetical protein FFWV33_10915 [Flavobacterium faecale]|uniref:BLUF domain-containing protein n=1 Tax=Flavobacterium faecale TaxID=1355330 RepID=A0A2S1LE23_9FLAO|nr:BLUF domain-containing protein [Flavobacterium faecale]AWG21989.1 hypothetical protein FFWV33_10915 [Flavobacterium faecale]